MAIQPYTAGVSGIKEAKNDKTKVRSNATVTRRLLSSGSAVAVDEEIDSLSTGFSVGASDVLSPAFVELSSGCAFSVCTSGSLGVAIAIAAAC